MKKMCLIRIISLVLIVLMTCLGLSACHKSDGEIEEEIIITENEKRGRVSVPEGMLGAHGEIVENYSGDLGYDDNILTALYFRR